MPAAIIGGLLMLYAIVGFLVVPAVARSQAVDYLRDTHGLDLAIDRIRFNPFTLSLRVHELALDDGAGARLVSFEDLDVNVGWRSLFERAIIIQAIELTEPFVHVHLRADGSLNLVEAFAGAAEEETEPDEKPAGGPPTLVIDDFVLAGGEVRFTDDSDGRGFDRRFAPLDLRLREFSTRPSERSELVIFDTDLGEGGRLTISGALSAEPPSFDLVLVATGIPLAMAQPYVPDTLAADVADGALSFTLNAGHGLAGQATDLAVRGVAAVTDLRVEVGGRDEPVLAWDEVMLEEIEFDLQPNRLHIGKVAIAGVDTAFRIYRDGDTNVGAVLRTAAGERDDEAGGDGDAGSAAAGAHPQPGNGRTEDAGEDFPFSIGRIVVEGSTLLFNDQQIAPPVAIRIDGLAGEITGLATEPGSRIAATITGVVGDHGGADIDGGAALFADQPDLDADVSFTNVEMTSFSPYAGRFAGYEISKGKLFLDLQYTLEGSRIKGENRALLDQFELGERVDSEDATSLPVKFALSLLRDRQGRIELSLPVEGDIDAPGFSFGHLIGQTLVNVVTRIVTAPFDFIAGLFGGGPEMEYADFDAGSGALAAAEREKILPLSNALEERPQLIVEVQGWADPEADGAALRQHKLNAALAEAAAAVGTDDDRLAVLEAAYDAHFGAGTAAALREEMAAGGVEAGAGEAPAESAGGGAPGAGEVALPGDSPNGDAPEGDAPEGDAPEGDAPEGDAPEGDAPEGDAPDGDAPDSDVASTDAPAGDGDAATTEADPDPAALEAELRARLLAAQPITPDELIDLAYRRGRQVMDVLVTDGGIAADRIFVRRGAVADDEGTRARLILDAR